MEDNSETIVHERLEPIVGIYEPALSEYLLEILKRSKAKRSRSQVFYALDEMARRFEAGSSKCSNNGGMCCLSQSIEPARTFESELCSIAKCDRIMNKYPAGRYMISVAALDLQIIDAIGCRSTCYF
jgi:hypothetical protein